MALLRAVLFAVWVVLAGAPAVGQVPPSPPSVTDTADARAPDAPARTLPLPVSLASVERLVTLPSGAPYLCTAREADHRSVLVTSALLECPDDVLRGVDAWEPDVLVALGGGILPGGVAGCSTTQRAYSTWRLFERMRRRPAILLSGRGPRWPDRALDSAEVACVSARITQQGGGTARARAHVRAVAREARGSLSEAELMCAVILRQVPDDERPAVVRRMIFEPDSHTTSENVALATPLVLAHHFHRVLVVTTPALRPRGVVDDHVRRAVGGFRTARPSSAAFLVAGVGCPFMFGGPPGSVFESHTPAGRARRAQR